MTKYEKIPEELRVWAKIHIFFTLHTNVAHLTNGVTYIAYQGGNDHEFYYFSRCRGTSQCLVDPISYQSELMERLRTTTAYRLQSLLLVYPMTIHSIRPAFVAYTATKLTVRRTIIKESQGTTSTRYL
jgi:hypothetical protein